MRRCVVASRWTLVLFALLLPLCTRAEVSVLRVPAGGLEPDVVVAADGTVHLVYVKGDARAGEVYYVRRGPAETTFSAPLQVNSQPGSVLYVGTVRGARLAVGKGGRVHVVWLGSGKADPRGPQGVTPLLYSRLSDDGKSFSPQRNLMQSSGGLDGGATVAADDAGGVYAIWHGGGPPEANRSVYLARSTDDGVTFAPEVAVLPQPLGACACCGIEARVLPGGALVALYRSATKMVNRDAYALVSTDHGKTFTCTLLSAWESKSCPMSTACVTAGEGGALVAWETNNQVSFAQLAAAGKVVTKYDAPGQGERRKYPAVARNAKGLVCLAWTEGTGWERGGKLKWQVFAADGSATSERGEKADLPAWGRPAVIASADGNFTVLY